ncbi:nuclear transport factor 2 family protein [Nonomuraea sp. NBC_01738]|uniref:nuclear transport factor 2 family protein n=1 Tax=Nonomuraea sp. NBC_01738 TaxID=2976003 RepID=UPI002E127D7D|nr:nuclear transport factor 2 family protein [Nonomuraea sp. NBC_01738]
MSLLFDRQLDAIAADDLEALMTQYHDDATVIRLDRVASGPEEIRAFFADYLALRPVVEEVTAVRETTDTILYRATMTIGGNRVTAFGTLVLRDGKIWRQTAAALPQQ